MNLEICMSSDDNYCMHMGISMISIMENTQNNVNFHILNNNLSKENIRKLNSIKEKYPKMQLFLYDVNKFIEENNITKLLMTNLKNNEFFNLLGASAYSRLFLEDILPKDISKILYLDVDTVILEDISKIYNTDIKNYSIAGVIDSMSNIGRYIYQGPDLKRPFVNSGVLLINMDNWRKNKFCEKSMEFIANYSDKDFLHDQHIINIIADEILLLNPKFNVYSIYYYVNYEKIKKMNQYFYDVSDFYDTEEVNKALENPTLVHFISQIWDRPWLNQMGLIKHKVKNPFNEKYLFYKKLSPWKDQEIQKNEKSFTQKAYVDFNRFMMRNFPGKIIALLFAFKFRQ